MRQGSATPKKILSHNRWEEFSTDSWMGVFSISNVLTGYGALLSVILNTYQFGTPFANPDHFKLLYLCSGRACGYQSFKYRDERLNKIKSTTV